MPTRNKDLVKLFPSEMRGIVKYESADGTNIRHKTMQTGMHKGTTAAGFTGIMPKTAKDIILADKNLAAFRPMLNMTPNQITALLNKNPQIEAQLAASHWNRIKTMFPTHEQRVYAWNAGLTGAQQARPEQVASSDYVMNVLRRENQAKNEMATPPPAPKIPYALTPGKTELKKYPIPTSPPEQKKSIEELTKEEELAFLKIRQQMAIEKIKRQEEQASASEVPDVEQVTPEQVQHQQPPIRPTQILRTRPEPEAPVKHILRVK